MTPGARAQAAIEILDDLAARPRPADRALRDWAQAHRFAGSKDRAAIRSLVFTVFRHRGAAAAIMGRADGRALVLGALAASGEDIEAIAHRFGDGRHAAAPLGADERAALARARPDAAGAVNFPAYLAQEIAADWGDEADALMAALLATAPLDLRVHAGRATREGALAALSAVGFPAAATRYSPWGIRVARDEDLIGANIRALPLFRDGRVEIQDEGSQLAALLSGARPGMQIAELCAGGGGKTVALAAMTGNTGQIHSADIDAKRMKAAQERVRRADAHNVSPRIITPFDPKDGAADAELNDLAGRMDLVFIDAPCSGSGAWRRAPDAKWRLAEGELGRLTATQDAILRRAAPLTRPGGRLVYVTCSVLRAENADRIAAFLDAHPACGLADGGAVWEAALGGPAPDGVLRPMAGGAALQLSPITTGTDGFFIAVLTRSA